MTGSEEEPKDVMVLSAIAKGHNTEEKIAKATGLSQFDVAMIVERLILHGLIVKREKKGFLGKRKVELGMTEKGQRELEERRYELEQRWQRMVMLAEQGKRQEFEREALSMRSWIPIMLFMGIMDMMMWMTMLNMMNLAAQDYMPEQVPGAGGGGGGRRVRSRRGWRWRRLRLGGLWRREHMMM
ncbi:MAG: hypothetical protein NZ888_05460 [Candidatus Nitrosocaldus sp.]|nr:hypothetical protein [Candidatus Nitrosocaldus sp.]MDW8000579.1 hypothetical protein [Candidatus Nitrosocaldus sp.]